MYGYDNWGYGYGYGYGWGPNNAPRGTDDNCAVCAGGRVGCGWTTYHNNELLGSFCRTVKFTKLERRCICGEEIDVLVPDRPFFDRLRFDCTKCRDFWAEICVCLPFGDTRDVFIADGPKCEKLLPLESAKNGFIISCDQIQPFTSGHGKLKMVACFQKHNNHISIANYFRKHAKCDCREEFFGRDEKGCGCGCGEFEDVDGYVDGRDGYIDGNVDGMADGYQA